MLSNPPDSHSSEASVSLKTSAIQLSQKYSEIYSSSCGIEMRVKHSFIVSETDQIKENFRQDKHEKIKSV